MNLKPADLGLYLWDFVSEMEQLSQNGLYFNIEVNESSCIRLKIRYLIWAGRSGQSQQRECRKGGRWAWGEMGKKEKRSKKEEEQG